MGAGQRIGHRLFGYGGAKEIDNYNVALIDLAEGPRMMSRVDDVAYDRVVIGMPVRAKIVHESEQAFVVFVPAQAVEGSV